MVGLTIPIHFQQFEALKFISFVVPVAHPHENPGYGPKWEDGPQLEMKHWPHKRSDPVPDELFVRHYSFFPYERMQYHQIFGCAFASSASAVIADLVR